MSSTGRTAEDGPVALVTGAGGGIGGAVTAAFAAAGHRVFAVDRRTKGGLAVVKEAKRRAERLKRAPTQAETGMAVALFGTAVLAGSPLADLHRMRQSDGGSSGGDSGSSGGCGGGGCGG